MAFSFFVIIFGHSCPVRCEMGRPNREDHPSCKTCFFFLIFTSFLIPRKMRLQGSHVWKFGAFTVCPTPGVLASSSKSRGELK